MEGQDASLGTNIEGNGSWGMTASLVHVAFISMKHSLSPHAWGTDPEFCGSLCLEFNVVILHVGKAISE